MLTSSTTASKRSAAEALQRLGAVAGAFHLVALDAERAAQRAGEGRVVVDDQELVGRRAAPAPIIGAAFLGSSHDSRSMFPPRAANESHPAADVRRGRPARHVRRRRRRAVLHAVGRLAADDQARGRAGTHADGSARRAACGSPRRAGSCTSTRWGSSRPCAWRRPASRRCRPSRSSACGSPRARWRPRAVVPRALRLLRRRLPGAELVLEEAAAARLATRCSRARVDVGVWVAGRGARTRIRAIVETVLRREPLCVALPADHPLTRLEQLDAEALAATPRIGDGSRWRVESLRTAARARRRRRGLGARARAGGRAAAGRRGAAPAGRRPRVGAARGAAGHDVLSVGTLAVIDALRAASGASLTAREQQRWSRAAGV